MAKLMMFQVDAFAERVFSGNPAAVLVLEDWLPEEVMQAIAAENNLSETAFLRPASDRWELRWFTPVHEVDFCGHATLAAAHVLVTEFKRAGELMFATRVGELRVTSGDEGYRLDLPKFEPTFGIALPEGVSKLFVGGMAAVFMNFENIFVELPTDEAVRDFVPDLAAIANLYPRGLSITAAGTEVDFVSRYFAPGSGIPEDPVTGSTHSTLVPYWAKKLSKSTLLAYQWSPRGGRLACELVGDRVMVSGQAVTFMRAEIFL
ncbi:PhzF family phenazine biosynthesis protein [Methylocystis sp. 9N]|uniref:PhzF family phenazine biosynthesis protein n=1 Tax=Methylocystis borbori TaxID=3118750 RepID=A0ABU7XFH3_9HYPH